MDTVIAIVVMVALGAALVARDATARRTVGRLRRELADGEARLKEHDELASTGQVMSGLAQDLKSPLQGVLATTEVMLASHARDDDGAEELREIREHASRAAGIVRNLLAFTETSSLSRRPQDLNGIVTRAVDVCRGPLEAARIHVAVDAAARLPLAYVDGRHLEHVVATLLARPVDAPAAGDGNATLHVATRQVNDRLIIDIDDLSGGADEPAWAGDLAACRRVAEAHGGTLEVENRGDGGFRFHLELPVATA